MAKYADYAKDDLDDEIAEASQNAQERQENAGESGFELPPEFQGKSVEDVAKSYVELKKLYSRQANDLGAMRKNVDELIGLQSQQAAEPPTDPEPVVDIDAIYDDAEGAISRVAEKAVGSRIKDIESRLEKTERDKGLESFEKDYPDWRNTVEQDEFLEWVKEKPYRARLAVAADNYDFDAARDLFGAYAELQASKQHSKEEARKRERQLQDATLESGSAHVADPGEKFSRKNLMQARIAARHGDRNAKEWLAANADAIAVAYEEGRITD